MTNHTDPLALKIVFLLLSGGLIAWGSCGAFVALANMALLWLGKPADILAAARGRGLFPDILEGALTATETLTAPLSGTPCAAYRAEVAVDFETTAYDSATGLYAPTRCEKTLRSKERRVRFMLADRTGEAIVDPAGAEISWQEARAGRLDRSEMGDRRVVMSGMGGEAAAFIDMTRLNGFTGAEEILPLGGRVTVIGRVRLNTHAESMGTGGSVLKVIPPPWPWRFRIAPGGTAPGGTAPGGTAPGVAIALRDEWRRIAISTGAVAAGIASGAAVYLYGNLLPAGF